eukprot:scaffold17725_cov41-Attheya_sp.AAC.1
MSNDDDEHCKPLKPHPPADLFVLHFNLVRAFSTMDGSMASSYRKHTSNQCQLVTVLAAAFA